MKSVMCHESNHDKLVLTIGDGLVQASFVATGFACRLHSSPEGPTSLSLSLPGAITPSISRSAALIAAASLTA